MSLPLRPGKGGFLRVFGCGEFIRDFLMGLGPHDSATLDPEIGAPQADIFYWYKTTLIQETALDRATRVEEKLSKRQLRGISPDNIESLTVKYIKASPYKANGCRFHSFVVYFSNLRRLNWVEFSGYSEPSAFQDRYPQGQPRKYFRLTQVGRKASQADWRNPYKALYGQTSL